MSLLPEFMGRKSAAGFKWLAAFFLLSVFIISNVSAEKIPFVTGGELYSVDENLNVSKFLSNKSQFFTQRGVCKSKKTDYMLAWNQKSQELYHIDNNFKISAKVEVPGDSVFINNSYLLSQSNSFDDNKGFPLSFYKIKYSRFSSKFSLKKIWEGNLDCFISDFSFIDNGICIGGGTRDNSKNNVFFISERGIHKCYSGEKNSNFLRIVANPSDSNKIYLFNSEREKISSSPVIYSVNIKEDNTVPEEIDLSKSELFPQNFECFFGYGFSYKNEIILPVSINEEIAFLKYDYDTKTLETIYKVTGCFYPLGLLRDEFIYIARDPLLPETFYGISTFNGSETRRICEF